MAATTMDSSGHSKMPNQQITAQRNRLALYWINGGLVLMVIMFYFLLRPQTTTVDTHMSESTGLYDNTDAD